MPNTLSRFLINHMSRCDLFFCRLCVNKKPMIKSSWIPNLKALFLNPPIFLWILMIRHVENTGRMKIIKLLGGWPSSSIVCYWFINNNIYNSSGKSTDNFIFNKIKQKLNLSKMWGAKYLKKGGRGKKIKIEKIIY